MIVIADSEKKLLCKSWCGRLEVNKNNVFSTAATLAAYTKAESWLDQVIDYLAGNVETLRLHLRQKVPRVRLVEPEGTYLGMAGFPGAEPAAQRTGIVSRT